MLVHPIAGMSSLILFPCTPQTVNQLNLPRARTHIYKYPNDKALLGLIIDDNRDVYLDEVKKLVTWCDDNFLQLNTKKTKELVVDLGNMRNYEKCLCAL